MRNYTLRIVKGSSLFSLLIITLWVLPVCMSCTFEELGQQNQSNIPSLSEGQEEVDAIDIEEIYAEESVWICVVCRYENGQHGAICYHCNAVRPQGNQEQSQEEKEEQQEEVDEASELQEESEDPTEECPVCFKKFTQAQQAECKYWSCSHFVCEKCYKQIKTTSETKGLTLACPICRNTELSKGLQSK